VNRRQRRTCLGCAYSRYRTIVHGRRVARAHFAVPPELNQVDIVVGQSETDAYELDGVVELDSGKLCR
jgi:hypothetical protein